MTTQLRHGLAFNGGDILSALGAVDKLCPTTICAKAGADASCCVMSGRPARGRQSGSGSWPDHR